MKTMDIIAIAPISFIDALAALRQTFSTYSSYTQEAMDDVANMDTRRKHDWAVHSAVTVRSVVPAGEYQSFRPVSEDPSIQGVLVF